jgi:hypothetical protein
MVERTKNNKIKTASGRSYKIEEDCLGEYIEVDVKLYNVRFTIRPDRGEFDEDDIEYYSDSDESDDSDDDNL